MTTMFHGGRTLDIHDGLCLADSEEIAEEYAEGRGGMVFALELPSSLEVREVEMSREDRDDMNYPGDRAAERRALEADGVDVIMYDDETPNGRQHRTYRLVSARAVAALRS